MFASSGLFVKRNDDVLELYPILSRSSTPPGRGSRGSEGAFTWDENQGRGSMEKVTDASAPADRAGLPLTQIPLADIPNS